MKAPPGAALALAALLLQGLGACHRATPERLGQCPVQRTTLAHTADAVPLGVAVHQGTVWSLLGRECAQGVTVSLRREGPRAGTVLTVDAPRWNAVSSLVALPDGVAFAVGVPGHVRAWRTVAGEPRVLPFPRGELPRGRDAHTPAVQLTAEGGGQLSALLRFPQPYGVVRVHTQDVGEASQRTPLRPDTWSQARLTLVGDQVVVVQRRERRGWFDGAPLGATLELATTPTSPWSTAPLAVTPFGEDGEAPQVAPYGDGPSAGVALLWRTPRQVWWAVAPRAPEGVAWTVGAARPLPLSPANLALAPLGPPCGILAASLGDELQLVALAPTQGTHGEVLHAPPDPTALDFRMVRGGGRTWLAGRDLRGVQIREVVADGRCALALREVPLPTALRARARIAGLAGDETHAVLALTDAAVDAAATTLDFVTLDRLGAATVAPPRELCHQSVAAISLLGSVVVAAGRGPTGLVLRRMNDPEEERYDDLLLRASVGAELSLEASASRHRVWVTDRSDERPSPFGPPRAVVLYSAIDTLEDGPRTEVRTAVPHAAQFDDLSLALAETGAARRWAMTWAGSTDTPCIPGAWAAVTDENDAPVTLPGVQGPWTHARPLVPDGACEDRVLGAAWRGARGTALLATARAGLELTELDLTSGAQRRWALQPPGARVVTAGFALGERGGLALWQVPGERALRMRRVRADGTPDAVQGTLPAELRLQPERRPLPVAVVGDDAVALVPTTRGAELLRMECGARPRAR